MTPEHPIILCGFTSSGKTTIGKLLSEQLGLPFYDTDQMLIEHYKMTIPEIFAEGGESLFRDYEHEIARQVCGLGPSVVYRPPVRGLLPEPCVTPGTTVI